MKAARRVTATRGKKNTVLAVERRTVWRTFSVHYFFNPRCRLLAYQREGEENVNAVERAFGNIMVQPALHAFYTAFAGDMPAASCG